MLQCKNRVVPVENYLHLQGNALSRVPEDFFQQLANLVWLDLRYNRISSLPPGVGAHRYLKSLLLEGNPIKALPVELGDLSSLKALNLKNCPLEFPPIDIVQKGLPSILSFLQNARAGKYEHDELSIPETPPIEKLKLADLTKSSLDLSEEWPNEEAMKLFQNLRVQIMAKEKEEIIEGQSFGKNVSKEKPAHHLRKKSILNDPSMYDSKIKAKRDEERKQAALKELREKQAVLEQRKRDQEILKEWRKESGGMQEKKEMNEKGDYACRFPPAIRDQVPKSTPYSTDRDRNPIVDTLEPKRSLVSKQQENTRRMSMKSIKDFEQARASRNIELEHRIKQHILMLQGKRKQPKVTAVNELQAAKEDLDTAEMLQSELNRMREESPLEYRFTAFTGEVSPSPPPKVQSQNIISKMHF